MPEFLSLPNELIFEIAETLPLHDISALLKTNHRLSNLLPSTLLTELFHSRSLTHGRRLLYQLASRQDMIRVKVLQANGILGFTEPGTLLHEAVKSQNVQALETLLNLGLNPDEYDSKSRTPLGLAAQLGRVDCARVLAKRRDVDIDRSNYNHKTPLLLAVKGGHEEIVRILVRAAGDDRLRINYTTWQGCLHRAAKRGHVPILRFLLDYVDPNELEWDKKGRPALHKAVLAGNCLAVECLLADERVNANIQDGNRHTALHIAVSRQQVEIVKLLLSHPRVEINLDDHYGRTPLHDAVAEGNIDMVRLLLSSPGVDVNLREASAMRNTALRNATIRNRLEIVQLCIEDSRLDVDFSNCKGKSPLELAGQLRYVSVIELLLQHPKIDLTLCPSNGERALDIANPARGTSRMRALDYIHKFW